MNNTAGILDEFLDALEPLCQEAKWERSKAIDPFAVYDILYQRTGNGVVVVSFQGDSIHQQVATDCVSKVNVSITASSRRDLADPLGGTMSSDSGLALLEMVDRIKSIVLAMEVDNGLSENVPRYNGTTVLSTPEGIPLDAYQVNFWVYAVSTREEESSSSSESSSSDSSSNGLSLYVSGAGIERVNGIWTYGGTEEVSGQTFQKWTRENMYLRIDASAGWRWVFDDDSQIHYFADAGGTPEMSPVGLEFQTVSSGGTPPEVEN